MFVLLAGLVFIIVFVVTAAAAVATVGDVFGACVWLLLMNDALFSKRVMSAIFLSTHPLRN